MRMKEVMCIYCWSFAMANSLNWVMSKQLELGDVERAIADPDIKPAAVHTAESKGGAYRM